MKKLLLFAGIPLALLLVALLVASAYLGEIVTAGVNAYAPGLTQTKVVLGSASISPFSGSGTLRNFVVGNPKGWSDADLASFHRVHVEVDPGSVRRDHVVVRDIDVDGPEFSYETKLVSSNVADLTANISRFGSGGAPAATAKNGKPLRLEVKHFRVHNGWVRLGVGKAAARLPLPAIELSDIGTSEGGITPDRFATVVARKLTETIVGAAAREAGRAAATTGAAAAEGVSKAGSAIKGLFGGKK